MMALVEFGKSTLVTSSMVLELPVRLPLRTQPVGVPAPLGAMRLVPLSKVEFGQKLLGRGWLRAVPQAKRVAAPSRVRWKFIVNLRSDFVAANTIVKSNAIPLFALVPLGPKSAQESKVKHALP